jgi:hypothetical protein
MLSLLGGAAKKKAAQGMLERNLKSALTRQGVRNIGFPGGNVDLPLYSTGEGELWAAFGGPTKDSAVQRYWNAFGVYQPDKGPQSIAVEINIPTDSNGAQVAGFFAEDSETGDIFLMHSGRVGGGRPGIGKSAFLVWSKAKLVEVTGENGEVRSGIAVGKIDDPDFAGRVWTFVRSVHRFKEQAASGALETPEFKKRVEEFDRYSKEFSGKKRGSRGGSFEYLTYHGDIVQKLYEERTSRLSAGETVFNSPLIDLFVKRDGALSEVYEVKTGVGRQMLYTAIGQLVTHATNGHGDVAKILVIPTDDSIPEDLAKAISHLGIKVRRFRLEKTGRNRIVELD